LASGGTLGEWRSKMPHACEAWRHGGPLGEGARTPSAPPPYYGGYGVAGEGECDISSLDPTDRGFAVPLVFLPLS
jgi:hypothetical protein